MTRGSLFVVSGPSGTGKGEIVKNLLKKHPDVHVSVSCTSRAPRKGEIDGVHYHFIKTEEEFTSRVENGEFYEHAWFDGHQYGTLKKVVSDELDKGFDLILEIDVQGCLQALEQDKSVTGIFVCPPDRDTLEKRLTSRGTNNADSIKERLGNAAREIKQAYKYDYIVVNEDWNAIPDALDIATEQVYSIIMAKRLEKANRVETLDKIAKSFE